LSDLGVEIRDPRWDGGDSGAVFLAAGDMMIGITGDWFPRQRDRGSMLAGEKVADWSVELTEGSGTSSLRGNRGISVSILPPKPNSHIYLREGQEEEEQMG